MEFCDNTCHTATSTSKNDTMRNATTCTCNIIMPVCTSTPNCSQTSLVDCCPDVCIIENTPQSQISNDCCNLDCSASCSSNSVHSEPNMICCERELQDQLSRTCNLACKTSCEKTKTCLSTKTCPSTLDFAKEWLTNKTFELGHKIQDMVYSQPEPCESKHVDFSNSCEIKCKHYHDPSPCQPVRSCNQSTDKSHDQPPATDGQRTSQPGKSISYIDIAGKLCELCKHVLDPAPCQPVKPCRHVDIADKLCENCKHILDCAPCQSDKSCKYCDIADKFCKRCKYILVTASGQSVKTFSYVDIAEKLCELCKHVLDPAPCQTDVKSCRHLKTADKLCEGCKHIIDSAPCEPDTPCTHCDISAKLCKQCKIVLDSTPSQPGTPCNLIDIADKSCGLCKPVLDPVPCQLENPCKHCDITKKLCKECKRILDSATCQTDKSCKYVAIADKLCELCKLLVDPVPCHPVNSCKQIKDSAPCKPVNSCKHCGITKKLCKECKRIFGCQTCTNVDIAEMLCKHCRHIYDSASCQTAKSCVKHVDIADKSSEQCKVTQTPAPSKPAQSCKNCDISRKLCKTCKNIFDSAPSTDRSCKNVDFANKLCEDCRHIYDSAPCHFIKPCLKHVDISNKSCEKSKYFPKPAPSNHDNYLCKHCDVTKKLCKKCKLILDSAPCIDRSCKNLDIADKLCELCKHIYASAPCQLVESCELVDNVETPCELKCKYDLDSLPSQSETTCRLADIGDKSCEGGKHVPVSVLYQPFKPFKHIHVQVPEKTEGCKKFEELFINDQAAGCSSADFWECGKCACALESQSAATLTTLSPIIKKEAKSTCFDVAKESICRSSGSTPESPSSSCASARARYYQNKLLSTLQILQNKEETVRVQAESLAVAESRIAALNSRHTDLRREIERKEREIQSLRKNLKECRTCRVDMYDVSLMADVQSVKQENLIEMLRKSYLDVRLMEKQKSDRISKLNNVINTQKWSLDRCQDIATEVDNLKMEISNFINSSNNDSGMWEESVVGGLSEDLQDIAAQLLRLGELLTGDCTCGLEQENLRLRQENGRITGEISSLRTQISALEANLQTKDCLGRQCKEQIESKETELNCIRGQMHALMENTREKAECCDSLTQQLTETKALLDNKTTELCCTQKQCQIYEDTANVMKQELNKCEEINKENVTLRKELCCVSRRVAREQRRAAQLEGELARARACCQRTEAACREKTANAAELERQLESAHARGAELCAEARRVVRAVRRWAARMRDMHREQEKQIEEKECKLRCIQNELHKRQLNICPRVWEQIEQTCSARASASEPSATCSKTSKSECPTVTFCVGERRHEGTGSSASEIASCSSTPVLPGPVDAAQCPAEEPSCSASEPPTLPTRTNRKRPSACVWKVSPGEEMFSRMESLSAALADGYKRWSRRVP